MTAWYNEIDPYAAQWLRNLIDAGHIAPGVVDERSIEDVTPAEIAGYTQCHFFAGIGVWSLALRSAGWPDDRPIWTGSCPCQPFSAAGKGAGFADERHLWPAWQHLIAQCRPPVVLGEQSAKALEWLRLVASDLEGMGYAVGCRPIEAASAGAKHKRDRIWFVADTERNEQPWKEPRIGPAGRVGRFEQSIPWNTDWESALRSIRAMGYGVARCVGGSDAARNAIVPQVAAAFIESYCEARELMLP